MHHARDGRDGQGDRDRVSQLALANGFEMVDVLPAPDAGQDFTFLIAPIPRNNNCDRLPDCFFCGVSEHALRALVPARDDAIEVLAYNGVVTELDDCRKSSLTFVKGDFGLPALGNVYD